MARKKKSEGLRPESWLRFTDGLVVDHSLCPRLIAARPHWQENPEGQTEIDPLTGRSIVKAVCRCGDEPETTEEDTGPTLLETKRVAFGERYMNVGDVVTIGPSKLHGRDGYVGRIRNIFVDEDGVPVEAVVSDDIGTHLTVTWGRVKAKSRAKHIP